MSVAAYVLVRPGDPAVLLARSQEGDTAAAGGGVGALPGEDGAVRRGAARVSAMVAALLLAVTLVTGPDAASAQPGADPGTVELDIRVWQHVRDPLPWGPLDGPWRRPIAGQRSPFSRQLAASVPTALPDHMR